MLVSFAIQSLLLWTVVDDQLGKMISRKIDYTAIDQIQRILFMWRRMLVCHQVVWMEVSFLPTDAIKIIVHNNHPSKWTMLEWCSHSTILPIPPFWRTVAWTLLTGFDPRSSYLSLNPKKINSRGMFVRDSNRAGNGRRQRAFVRARLASMPLLIGWGKLLSLCLAPMLFASCCRCHLSSFFIKHNQIKPYHKKQTPLHCHLHSRPLSLSYLFIYPFFLISNNVWSSSSPRSHPEGYHRGRQGPRLRRQSWLLWGGSFHPMYGRISRLPCCCQPFCRCLWPLPLRPSPLFGNQQSEHVQDFQNDGQGRCGCPEGGRWTR